MTGTGWRGAACWDRVGESVSHVSTFPRQEALAEAREEASAQGLK